MGGGLCINPKSLHAQYDRRNTQLMRTDISIPNSILEATDSLAERLGMSRSELFRRAVEEYIESHRYDDVREALDRVYSEESSGLDERLAQMQFASLEHLERD